MTTSEQTPNQNECWVLQFYHNYDNPFLNCAQQYTILFQNTPYKIYTIYLTNKPNTEIEHNSTSNKIIFLNYSNTQIRNLTWSLINFLILVIFVFERTWIYIFYVMRKLFHLAFIKITFFAAFWSSAVIMAFFGIFFF